ncbi:MAG: ATP-binding protein [Sandaracinaceae bacterium]|nr:ATP-binding protein [Sandaracinaceae bacterium]
MASRGSASRGTSPSASWSRSRGPETKSTSAARRSAGTKRRAARGPTGRAIREGRPVPSNAAASDASMAPWVEAALARGYASACALPLRVGGDVVGNVNVYAARENAFDAHEIALLENLVGAAERGIELFRAREGMRQALEEARAARDQLRAIHDASPDMIFVHASDGRLLDVNDVVLAHANMDRETFLSTPLDEMTGGGYRLEEVQAQVRRGLELGSLDFEWGAKPPGPISIPVEVRLRRLPGWSGAPGEPALVAVVRDLSERKRLEAEVLERAKLESLASFAGGVAHDFNNYLTAALGALTLAMRELGREHPMSALLDDAVDAASRARGLTRQLLAFARGGASVPTVFALGPLLEQTARLALAGSAVATRFTIAPDLRPLSADPDQIAQVFHNLFLNAAQAMPTGGSLTVRARNVELPGARPPLEAGRYVRVEVVDTGPGIDPETLARIFDPFFTTKPEGSGLGLPTAFAVVRRHGGELTVESAPGRGTSFVVTLPSTDAALPRGAAKPERRVRPLRILLLDDEDGLRRVIRRILEELGHEVIEAAEGDQALAIARVEAGGGAVRRRRGARSDHPRRAGRARDLRGAARAAPEGGHRGHERLLAGRAERGALRRLPPKPFGVERLEEVLAEVVARMPSA